MKCEVEKVQGNSTFFVATLENQPFKKNEKCKQPFHMLKINILSNQNVHSKICNTNGLSNTSEMSENGAIWTKTFIADQVPSSPFY